MTGMTIELLTTAQVAAARGVSVDTVQRWARSGVIPVAFRVAGRTGAMLFDPTVAVVPVSGANPKP